MTLNEWLTILAIVLAPVFAVQVQKWLEIFREERARRLFVFKTLMATRAATVSSEHVQALNMIDLEFRGKRYKHVTDSWKTYLDHLDSFPKEQGESALQLWAEKRADCLTTLLMEMGKCLGYDFDAVHVKKGVYAPKAHGQMEEDNLRIRREIINLLSGESGLKIHVGSLPFSLEEIAEQKAIREALLKVLTGKEPISVSGDRLNGERKENY